MIHLRLPASGSLKEKRRILRSIIDRVHTRFNVSIAEVGDHDSWRETSLAVSCISNSGAHANAVLSRVVEFVRQARLDAEILDYEIDISQPF